MYRFPCLPNAPAFSAACRLPDFIGGLAGAMLLTVSLAAGAQQLAPRAYWPAPVGTNVVVLTYQHSQGDVVVDQSLPVTGVESNIDYTLLTYQRSVDIWGRSASASISQGFADGTTEGVFQDAPFRRRTVGALDTVGRIAINLRGAPAMDGKAFSALTQDPETLIGASLTVLAPTGEYDEDRVINLGTNRWAVRPGLGVIQPLGSNLLLEGSVALWVFQDNDDFLGARREQKPIGSAEVHLIKRFSGGIWASVDANFYTGGRTTVDGARNSDVQRNSRFGATLVYPFSRGNALRFSASTGTVTETGGDYDLFSLAWIQEF